MNPLKRKIEQIEKRIDKLGISHIKTELMANLKINYRLSSLEVDNYEALGNTRLGGFPDLPRSYDYPVNKAGYYNLILQLNFAEFEIQIDELPEKGILYIFHAAENSDDFKTFYIDETDNLEKKMPPSNLLNLNVENRQTDYSAFKAKFDLEHYFKGELLWEVYESNPKIYNELIKTNSNYHTQIIAEPFGGLDSTKNAYLALNGFDTLLNNVVGLYPKLNENEFRSQMQALMNECDLMMVNPKSNKQYFIRKKEQLIEFNKNRKIHLSNYLNTKCVITIESIDELKWQWGDMGDINVYMDKSNILKKQFDKSYINISSS